MRILSRLFYFISFIFLLASCGSNENELAQQYIDACAENDFGKANAILDKMDIDSDHGKDYGMSKHRAYVNKKETLFLIAQGDNQSVNRLLFLLEENNNIGISEDEIVRLAISQNNEYLVDKLIETGRGITYANVDAAILAKMDSVVYKIVEINPRMFEFDDKIADYFKKSNPAFYNNKVEQILIQNFDRLQSFTGISQIKAGYYYSTGTPTPLDKIYDEYNEKVTKLNSACEKFILMSLKYDNKKFAKKALSLMLPTANRSDFVWLTNARNREKVTLNYDAILRMKSQIESN